MIDNYDEVPGWPQESLPVTRVYPLRPNDPAPAWLRREKARINRTLANQRHERKLAGMKLWRQRNRAAIREYQRQWRLKRKAES